MRIENQEHGVNDQPAQDQGSHRLSSVLCWNVYPVSKIRHSLGTHRRPPLPRISTM